MRSAAMPRRDPGERRRDPMALERGAQEQPDGGACDERRPSAAIRGVDLS
jgi:hypothetical protein